MNWPRQTLLLREDGSGAVSPIVGGEEVYQNWAWLKYTMVCTRRLWLVI